MTESIISVERIKAKAASAFALGQSRDSHGMNWDALALPTWLNEYDRLAAEALCEASTLEMVPG